MSKARNHERVYSSFVGNGVYIYRQTGRRGGRGIVGRRDVNRVDSGFAVGVTDVPHIYTI